MNAFSYISNIGRHREKILWLIFLIVVVIGIADITTTFLGLNFFKPAARAALLLAAVLLILHAGWTLTYRRGLALILLCWLTGLIFEAIGVNYGFVFGGHYVYQSDNSLMLFGVPWSIPFYWAALIYAGYNVVTSFLFWANRGKPDRHSGNATWLPLLIFLDGMVVVAIDLLMEPLQVMARNWAWLDNGPYYGIPIGNFAGWFAVTVISTGIFRASEYLCPSKPTVIDKSVLLIPVVGYGMLCLAFVFLALMVRLPELAVTGLAVMFPIVIANLILFNRWRKVLKKTG
jgi:putative membrane protein